MPGIPMTRNSTGDKDMSISHCRARRRLVALAATTTVATLAGLASPGLMAQGAFPSKAITMVVPYPPGGSNDVFARQVAKEMGDLLKQAVIVDNRPGASGNTGTASVRSEEHTSELQSPCNLVCRLLLEKKKRS